MTMVNAFNAALSGLSVTSRRAEAVSTNIANASTPGFARRQVELASGLAGGRVPGVQVVGVYRQEDLVILGQRRQAQAGLAGAEARAGFQAAMEGALGLPGEPGSLGSRLSDLEAALIEAASRPDSDSRLQSVVNRAKSAAGHLNDLSAQIQDERLAADRSIATSVDRLNATLQQIVDINTEITQFQASGRDANALIDTRQRMIDSVAELVPINQVVRPNGRIALYTDGGAMLVDSNAAMFGFTGAPEMTVYMTQTGGGLSGLTLNGQPIATDGGMIAGGRLAALFEVRDELAPAMQVELDALARNLIERLQDPAVDPTLTPGDPGLFTDAGLALDLTEETGLAGRIAVSALVDPAAGGAAWRLRDGLGAAAVGGPGNASILNAVADALADPRVPGSGRFTVARSLSGLAGDLLSHVSTSAFQAEAQVGFLQASTNVLLQAEMQDEVDTDQEMQDLLIIEQSYAANARVLSTLDEMMQQLLRL